MSHIDENSLLPSEVLSRIRRGEMLRIISTAIEGCDDQPTIREWECTLSSGPKVDHSVIVLLLRDNKIKREFYTQTCERFVLTEEK